MAIALLIGLMVASFQHRSIHHAWWVAAGTFGTGINLSNIFALALCFFASQRCARGVGITRAVRNTAVLAATTLVITFALASVDVLGSHARLSDLLPSATRHDFGVRFAGLSAPEQLAVAFSSTFAGVIQPDIIDNEYATNPLDKAAPPVVRVRLTFWNRRLNTVEAWSWTAVSLALLLIGAYRAYDLVPAWKSLVLTCGALVVFNAALHSFFYLHDMFLYALHWQVPLLFLLGGWMRKDRGPDCGPVALGVLALISALTGYHIVSRFMAVAATYS
jgi:hypothetical protein